MSGTMLNGMITVDNRPSERTRALAEMKREGRKSTILKSPTPLMGRLSKIQMDWLLEYASDRYQALESSLMAWRSKMERYEQFSDNDFSSRCRPPDPEDTNAIRSIFEDSNHTMGLVGGFCDFVFAQARDDIFGLRPWLGATPEGREDIDLAESVSKHLNWKFGQSNMQEALTDAIRMAVDLGTAFVKVRWDDMGETYVKRAEVAHGRVSEEPIYDEAGEMVEDEERLGEMGFAEGDYYFKEVEIEVPIEVKRNVDVSVLDWKNVVFDAAATELDLVQTEFFTKFQMGLHDLCAFYGLSKEQKEELINVLEWEPDTEHRDHRASEFENYGIVRDADADANPPIHLVEGFLRCDPLGTGRPIRIHVVFSPTLRVLFTADYLANVTPGGMLPVFPVRCFKTTRRILGCGYWEKFERFNDAVDEQYNAVALHNRQTREVFKGVNADKLKDGGEGQDVVNTPSKFFELEGENTINDAFSFLTMPDNSGRSVDLLNQMMQMGQMISGISSAAQGELKGVPQSNTATGVRNLTSRGAVLTKTPIEQVKADLECPVDFAAHLLYANQDENETFTWGEGRETHLVEIKAGDVKALRMNVRLTLTQSQNMEKLEHAQAAMGFIIQFSQLDPVQRQSYRRILVQSLTQLGFNDAEDMVEEAGSDPLGLIAMMPEELQPGMMQAYERLTTGGEGSESGASAPVTGDASSM